MSPAMLQLIVFAIKESMELYPALADLYRAIIDKREVTPTMWAQAHVELAGLKIELPLNSEPFKALPFVSGLSATQAEVFTGKIS